MEDNETRERTRRMHVQLDLPLAFLNRMNWIEMFAYVAHRSVLPTITCPIICLALYTYIYISLSVYIYISTYIHIRIHHATWPRMSSFLFAILCKSAVSCMYVKHDSSSFTIFKICCEFGSCPGCPGPEAGFCNQSRCKPTVAASQSPTASIYRDT
jgi:hypothetical protein